MRQFPSDDDDRAELARLNAEPWMVECLRLNPEYTHWGPHEDYMIAKDAGWRAPVFADKWAEFGPWTLDEMNEVVHFYFQVRRASKECEACSGSGLNPLGVHGKCDVCEGHGSVFTEPAATLGLVLWVLHPRKGAARGVEIKSIGLGDLPAVMRFLSAAAERNAARFAAVVKRANEMV